ncbi:type II secretion system protein [bacterium]|nr:type II secretion system protein [bacterium]
MRYSAFTLLEIIVVVAIITLLGSFLIPITISQIYSSKAEAMASIVASSIYNQQQNAFNGYENAEYGLLIQSDRVIMYTGNSYAQNISTKQILTEGVVLGASLGGGIEIHFEKNDLRPNVSGSVTAVFGSSTSVVQLNSEGLVFVQR